MTFWQIAISGALASFWGAVGGAVTVLLINWLRSRRKELATFNTAIVMLGSHTNDLLIMKKQVTLPRLEHYKAYLDDYIEKKSENINKEPPYKMYFYTIPTPNLKLNFAIETTYSYASIKLETPLLLIQTEKTILQLVELVKDWNRLVEKQKQSPDPELSKRYLGLPLKDGSVDTSIGDMISGMNQSVDDSLFFLAKSQREISSLAKSVLPCWLKKKVAKVVVTNDEHNKLLPPDDHIKGW